MYHPEFSHAPCLQCCSAVAWSRGSRGMADAMIEASISYAKSNMYAVWAVSETYARGAIYA